MLLVLLAVARNYSMINISGLTPSAYGLMSMLIGYLGVSKVNLAYGRYITGKLTSSDEDDILKLS